MDWETQPRRCGHIEVGVVKIDDMTVTIRHIGPGSIGNEPWFTVGIHFVDGCQGGPRPFATQAETEAYLEHLGTVSSQVTAEIKRRHALAERIRPLQNRAKTSFDVMLKLIKAR